MKDMDENQRKSALKEARIMEKLTHPNIIQSHDVYKTKKGKLCIVMEYADGGDLNMLIRKRKQDLKNGYRNAFFPEEEVLDIFCQIIMALQSVHQHRILHRDIKSHNVFLMKSMQVKLGDFGVSKVLSTTKSRAATIIGTPYYYSPEMCKGESYDTKSDIWSLGVLLFEMCALEYPFKGNNYSKLIEHITSSKYNDIPAMYSKSIHNLIRGLLQKEAVKRPNLKQILAHPSILAAIQRVMERNENYKGY